MKNDTFNHVFRNKYLINYIFKEFVKSKVSVYGKVKRLHYKDWHDTDQILKHGHVGLLVDKVKRGDIVSITSTAIESICKTVNDYKQFKVLYDHWSSFAFVSDRLIGAATQGGNIEIVELLLKQKHPVKLVIDRVIEKAVQGNHPRMLEYWFKHAKERELKRSKGKKKSKTVIAYGFQDGVDDAIENISLHGSLETFRIIEREGSKYIKKLIASKPSQFYHLYKTGCVDIVSRYFPYVNEDLDHPIIEYIDMDIPVSIRGLHDNYAVPYQMQLQCIEFLVQNHYKQSRYNQKEILEDIYDLFDNQNSNNNNSTKILYTTHQRQSIIISLLLLHIVLLIDNQNSIQVKRVVSRLVERCIVDGNAQGSCLAFLINSIEFSIFSEIAQHGALEQIKAADVIIGSRTELLDNTVMDILLSRDFIEYTKDYVSRRGVSKYITPKVVCHSLACLEYLHCTDMRSRISTIKITSTKMLDYLFTEVKISNDKGNSILNACFAEGQVDYILHILKYMPRDARIRNLHYPMLWLESPSTVDDLIELVVMKYERNVLFDGYDMHNLIRCGSVPLFKYYIQHIRLNNHSRIMLLSVESTMEMYQYILNNYRGFLQEDPSSLMPLLQKTLVHGRLDKVVFLFNEYLSLITSSIEFMKIFNLVFSTRDVSIIQWMIGLKEYNCDNPELKELQSKLYKTIIDLGKNNQKYIVELVRNRPFLLSFLYNVVGVSRIDDVTYQKILLQIEKNEKKKNNYGWDD